MAYETYNVIENLLDKVNDLTERIAVLETHMKPEEIKTLLAELVALGVIQPRDRLRIKDLSDRYGRDIRTIERWIGRKIPAPRYDVAGRYWLRDEIEALDLQYQMSAGHFRLNAVPGGKERTAACQ